MITISKDTDLRSAMISIYDDYQVSSDKQNFPLDYFNWGRAPRMMYRVARLFRALCDLKGL
jgi:hypothetical protein